VAAFAADHSGRAGYLLYSVGALVASLAPGFLTANLLFLNEFPDVVPDKKGGRYHMVIALGTRRAGWLYALLMAITYLCVLAGVVSKLMPALSLIAFLSIPFALRAIRIAFKHHDNPAKLVPALKANVLTVLSTDALLALAYLLDSFR
jgi:1,4-dihydroxy-2-naphthoate octaprenyltransferase